MTEFYQYLVLEHTLKQLLRNVFGNLDEVKGIEFE